MGAMNFRNGYKFDPDESENQNAGGLLGLLQAAMQQRQMQPGADYGSASNGSNGYGRSQGGLLARLAALQAEQSPYQSFALSNAPVPTAQPDPNFRQLVRVTPAARSAVDPSDRSNGQLRPSYVSFQGGDASGNGPADAGPQYPMQGPRSGRDSLSDYGDRPAPSFDGSAPTKLAQIVIPGPRGLPLPWPVATPEYGSEPKPSVPLPHIPDWWRDAVKVLQGYARSFSPNGGWGGDDYRRCLSAAEGDSNDWENLCRSLPSGSNNVAGNQSQNQACWEKTYESRNNKINWCQNQFGAND